VITDEPTVGAETVVKPRAAFGGSQIKFISRLSSFSWSPSGHSIREEPRKKRKTQRGLRPQPRLSAASRRVLNVVSRQEECNRLDF
jgi:hypothetical protein